MKYLTPITLLTLLSSCASIMNGTRQPIGICTNPSNAEVWLDNTFVGKSPIILEMTRSHNHYLRIELEGYEPYAIAFTREISGWVVGNLAFGGFIGLAVDALTGGIYKLTPDQVQVELREGNVSCSQQNEDAFIAVVLKADPSWEKIDTLASKTEKVSAD